MVRIVLSLAFIGLLGAMTVSAYPIRPRPLRALVQESEVIVVAEVEVVEKLGPDEAFSWNDAVAELAVVKTIQGSTETKKIQVYFSQNLICPAPAVYEEGTVVLAFLDRREDGPGFTTHALSYGAKTVTNSELAVYLDRIREMQPILGLTDQEDRANRTLDWLVACAAESPTRWEGTYELAPEGDFMSYYDSRPLDLLAESLSPEQSNRLFDSLTEAERIGPGELCLIELLKKTHGPDLRSFLIANLDPDQPAWIAGILMMAVADIDNTPHLKELSQEYEDLRIEAYDPDGRGGGIIRSFLEACE